MALYRILIAVTIAVLFHSCANQSSPTGGPKDETAPELQSSIPKHEALNFQEQTITLTYNEFVKLNNAKEEIIITPSIDQEYDIKYKKNKVIIEFEAPLDKNTTYTINLREGVQDITESNPSNDKLLAFSTGDYLDSLKISGVVKSLLTQEPLNNFTVGLYYVQDTLDIFNSKPVYLTRTDKDGKFTINNIKKAAYKIFAINDNNKNLTLESANEQYAFLSKTIDLDSNIVAMNLQAFGLNADSLTLQSNRSSGKYYIVKYNKYITDYTRSSADSLLQLPTSISTDHEEIKFYNTGAIQDSLLVQIDAVDSIGFQQQDSVYVKFEDSKREKDEYKVSLNIKEVNPDTPVLDAVFEFTKPTILTTPDSLFYEIDSANHIKFSAKDFTWNTNKTSLTIQKKLEAFDIKSNPEIPDSLRIPLLKNLYAGLMTFMSVEGDTSQLEQKRLKIKSNKDTGAISFEVVTNEPSYIIQLLSAKHVVIDEVVNVKAHTFEYLNPGDYMLRILIDSNSNGSWELGNILNKVEPEPVQFYLSDEGKMTIKLRANWEIGPLKIQF